VFAIISLSKQINGVTQTKLYRFIEKQVFDVSSLLLDDTFQPVTPLIDGVVNEAMRHLAPLRDDCTLELLDCIVNRRRRTCNYVSVKLQKRNYHIIMTLMRR